MTKVLDLGSVSRLQWVSEEDDSEFVVLEEIADERLCPFGFSNYVLCL